MPGQSPELRQTAQLAAWNNDPKGNAMAQLFTHRRPRALGVQLLSVAVMAATVIVTAPNLAAEASPGNTVTEAKAVEAKAARIEKPYTPKTGTVFNNPKSTRTQQRAIITQIERSIDGSKKGSTIRTAQYLFDLNSTADALIAAHKRGVHVQMLVDDGEDSAPVKRVKKALGTNKSKSSYVYSCRRGCMSSVRSVMHAKFYLFSRVGAASPVSMISSANPYTGNTSKSWNDIHTIVGDKTIYASLNQYFVDMLKDKTNYNYYRTTFSGKYGLYFFPRTPAPGTAGVTQLTALKKVKCTGVKSGYGIGGRTSIRVSMWGWTKWRTDVASQLWKLHNQGCNVYVVTNSKRVGEKVYRALLRRSSKYGVMRVYDGWYDKNHNGAAELYVHQKLLTINGNYNGNSGSKVLWTGSQNFTNEGNRVNNELILSIRSDYQVDRYNRNLNYIRDHATKGRITQVPGWFSKASIKSFSVAEGGGKTNSKATEESEFGFDLPSNGDVDFDR